LPRWRLLPLVVPAGFRVPFGLLLRERSKSGAGTGIWIEKQLVLDLGLGGLGGG